MEKSRTCLFLLGLPQPQECRLPTGRGGTGSARQCISDRGVIEQTILIWDAPRHLAFRMEENSLYFRPCVTDIRDDFELEVTDSGGTRITRVTNITVSGYFRWAKRAAMWVGLKQIHWFVFRNWQRLASTHLNKT